ncbi:hypothetical protein N7462_002587 [Penicillium macrosclerotiorum]|uniref:uncharacterized protein n=1 Tax=Penicillium macrosclerotiorum TaxID=303699 RepID=UPI0025496886|nr:uncharacterized protein N7462_002587 [Penicillium macrosclerotiorum]KAJ5693164.1 hypothetical protein N7462_002587 [Penicillium macrosclerotiorum]
MSTPTSPSSLSPGNLQVLPPILTDNTIKSSPSARDRLSTYSTVSFASQLSRPGSHVFPIFHSSLPYTLVRDFAYPPIHPLHYGPPPPRASGVSTPASEYRRLSDPPTSWDTARGPWASGPWSNENTQLTPGHQQLPAMSFGDGPPYSEDEDLHSPVVTSSRPRNKSTGTDLDELVNEHSSSTQSDRGTFIGLNPDGSATYYVSGGDGMEDGPGGEYVTYRANEGQYSMAYGGQQGYTQEPGFESEDDQTSRSRYSTDYQFAVGCPDEEMHGKAVALFDFVREHENELPLTEGQVIYVSYRHGQGWLVAEDPKTGENGLVPEEFVRLIRDIEGGLTSLNGEPGFDTTDSSVSIGIDMTEDEQVATPTQEGHNGANGGTSTSSSVESHHPSDNGQVAKEAGNRSSMMTKT